MLKVIMILQALCSGPLGNSPVCEVKWATMPSGGQSVAITGFYKEQVVICRIIDTATADCTAYRVDEPDATTGGEMVRHQCHTMGDLVARS